MPSKDLFLESLIKLTSRPQKESNSSYSMDFDAIDDMIDQGKTATLDDVPMIRSERPDFAGEENSAKDPALMKAWEQAKQEFRAAREKLMRLIQMNPALANETLD